MFVYVIINSENLKIYVGKTIREDLNKYLREKIWCAHTGKWKGRSHLFAAMQKYPSTAWSIHPLFQGQTDKEISEHEVLLIKALACRNIEVGYNLCQGGQGHRSGGYIAWNRGKSHSEETRRKLREARAKRPSSGMKGKTLSEEHRHALLTSITGRTVSEETRAKISESNKGQVRSEETRHKIGEANKIRFASEEARTIQSEAVKNSPFLEEARRKNSEAHMGRVPWNKGKKASLETRLKLSEAHKRPKLASF